jgi:hypothetical protein
MLGVSRFPLLLTADYADNTDLIWSQRPIWKPRNQIQNKADESGNEEKGTDVEENFLTFSFPD